MNTTEQTKPRLERIIPPHFQDLVTFRILKAQYKKSAQENPMIVWNLELLAPLEVDLDGCIYNLDGTLFPPVYIVLKSAKQDNEGFVKNFLHPKLGLPEELDIENPNTDQYEGIVFQAMLYSREDIAQRRNSQGEYEVIKDANGKPISKGWKWFFDPREIIGLASADPNVPF